MINKTVKLGLKIRRKHRIASLALVIGSFLSLLFLNTTPSDDVEAKKITDFMSPQVAAEVIKFIENRDNYVGNVVFQSDTEVADNIRLYNKRITSEILKDNSISGRDKIDKIKELQISTLDMASARWIYESRMENEFLKQNSDRLVDLNKKIASDLSNNSQFGASVKLTTTDNHFLTIRPDSKSTATNSFSNFLKNSPNANFYFSLLGDSYGVTADVAKSDKSAVVFQGVSFKDTLQNLTLTAIHEYDGHVSVTNDILAKKDNILAINMNIAGLLEEDSRLGGRTKLPLSCGGTATQCRVDEAFARAIEINKGLQMKSPRSDMISFTFSDLVGIDVALIRIAKVVASNAVIANIIIDDKKNVVVRFGSMAMVTLADVSVDKLKTSKVDQVKKWFADMFCSGSCTGDVNSNVYEPIEIADESQKNALILEAQNRVLKAAALTHAMTIDSSQKVAKAISGGKIKSSNDIVTGFNGLKIFKIPDLVNRNQVFNKAFSNYNSLVPFMLASKPVLGKMLRSASGGMSADKLDSYIDALSAKNSKPKVVAKNSPQTVIINTPRDKVDKPVYGKKDNLPSIKTATDKIGGINAKDSVVITDGKKIKAASAISISEQGNSDSKTIIVDTTDEVNNSICPGDLFNNSEPSYGIVKLNDLIDYGVRGNLDPENYVNKIFSQKSTIFAEGQKIGYYRVNAKLSPSDFNRLIDDWYVSIKDWQNKVDEKKQAEGSSGPTNNPADPWAFDANAVVENGPQSQNMQPEKKSDAEQAAIQNGLSNVDAAITVGPERYDQAGADKAAADIDGAITEASAPLIAGGQFQKTKDVVIDAANDPNNYLKQQNALRLLDWLKDLLVIVNKNLNDKGIPTSVTKLQAHVDSQNNLAESVAGNAGSAYQPSQGGGAMSGVGAGTENIGSGGAAGGTVGTASGNSMTQPADSAASRRMIVSDTSLPSSRNPSSTSTGSQGGNSNPGGGSSNPGNSTGKPGSNTNNGSNGNNTNTSATDGSSSSKGWWDSFKELIGLGGSNSSTGNTSIGSNTPSGSSTGSSVGQTNTSTGPTTGLAAISDKEAGLIFYQDTISSAFNLSSNPSTGSLNLSLDPNASLDPSDYHQSDLRIQISNKNLGVDEDGYFGYETLSTYSYQNFGNGVGVMSSTTQVTSIWDIVSSAVSSFFSSSTEVRRTK